MSLVRFNRWVGSSGMGGNGWVMGYGEDLDFLSLKEAENLPLNSPRCMSI